jgi:iron complex outermembrane receptor protein
VGAYPFLASDAVGQEPYALLNARVGWEWRRFALYAYGRNLIDQTYFAFAVPLGPGAGYATSPGDPRTFGMMATARF